MLVAVAIALISMQQGLLDRVVGAPTGANGYEEYMMAADLVSGERFGRFISFYPALFSEDLIASKADIEAVQAREKWQGFLNSIGAKNWLDVKRRLHKEYGRALDLVHLGNAKPMVSPRKSVTAGEEFPDLAGLKNLARLSSQSCDVLVADNRSSQAVTFGMDMVTLSMNIRGMSTLSNLVGVAIQSMSLAAFDANLERFSERDWQTVLAGSEALLARGNRLSEVADAEVVARRELYASSLEESGADGRKLTPAQRASFMANLDRHLRSWSAVWKQMVAQPESEWKLLSLPPIAPEIDEMVSQLAPAELQILMANAKATTQLRLLKLHAQVQIYRYQWGKLPATLQEAVPLRKDRIDPFATGEFQYEPLSERGYRLYSKGNKAIGEIDLKFKRGAVEAVGSDKPWL